MNLYTGSVLHVDLSAGTALSRPLRREWLRDYWGGWGLAARYFQEHSAPGCDPLAPENPVIIMTGPLCGTLVPLSARFCLLSKSPHNGTVFESNAGGAFGPELKFAGFDGIVVYVDRPGDTMLYAAGRQSRADEAQAEPGTLFKIASISKLYIAAATTRLVHDQVLSLDDSLA